jgi:hydrogenase nickel incorporation protein HypB
VKVVVVRNVLKRNQVRAATLRRRFAEAGTLAVNLISSPGSGKTSLIEGLIRMLRVRGVGVGVIEGDVATTNDAERIAAVGAPVVQVTTSGACHIDAGMGGAALKKLGRLPEVLFIENVGNLVCPAAFDLGESERVVLVSLPEGDDKPEKYPEAFAEASALVINKTDLRRACDFKTARAVLAARSINPALAVFETSCRTGRGLDGLAEWLIGRRVARFEPAAAPAPAGARKRRAPRKKK